jgi:hypothetical protein
VVTAAQSSDKAAASYVIVLSRSEVAAVLLSMRDDIDYDYDYDVYY